MYSFNSGKLADASIEGRFMNPFAQHAVFTPLLQGTSSRKGHWPIPGFLVTAMTRSSFCAPLSKLSASVAS